MPHKRKYVLDPAKTLAILIGIEEYEDFPRVDPAPNNVAEFGRLLADEEILGIPPDRIKAIVGGNSAEIKEALFDIFEEMQGHGLETLILYFVGHGYRRPNGEYYLAASDSKKRLLRLDGSTGIAFNTVKQILGESGIPQRLIFLDSCYSGSTTLGGEEGAPDLRLKGTYTISSSDSREVSYFDPEHRHTLFTGELINILRSGLDGGGEHIRLDELYGALKTAVRNRNPKMSPQQRGSEEITGGNYLFCKNRLFNVMDAQRKEVQAAVDLGDQQLKARDLQAAEYQYLRARQLAEEHGLWPDFKAEVQNRIKKLRYATELQADWEGGTGVEESSDVVSEPKGFFQGRGRWMVLGGLGALVVGMLVFMSIPETAELPEPRNKEDFTPSSSDSNHRRYPPHRINDSTKAELSPEEIVAWMGEHMVEVSGGSFTRGCTFEQADDCDENEQHLTEVTVAGFWLNRYEVTQAEWRAVMGSDPEELDFPGCDECPVTRVTWEEVQVFLQRLNEQTGRNYRLPTEAEWEYAARGGAESGEFKYAGGSDLDKVAWHLDNSDGKMHPVGSKAPNELGLYDMSGNVYEWCRDHYLSTYVGTPVDGAAWEAADSVKRVLRGGSYDHPARRHRVSSRSKWRPDKRYKDVGLRLAESR